MKKPMWLLLGLALIFVPRESLACHDDFAICDDDILFADCQAPRDTTARQINRALCDAAAERIVMCPDGQIFDLRDTPNVPCFGLEEPAFVEGVWRQYNEHHDGPTPKVKCTPDLSVPDSERIYLCVGAPRHFP